MHLPLKGIIPPLVTPLENYDKLDIQGLNHLIEHLISGGVHGIFILGTNGEAPSLDYRLRKELIKRTCEIVNHRVPLLVGITDTSFSGSVDLAKASNLAGADAVVIAPPFYFPIDQEEVISYFKTLTQVLPLPFYLYNIPSHTKIHMTVDTVKKVKEMGALGIKDSSGDMFYLHSLIETFKSCPEFSIFTGTELFLPETVTSGGHGAVAGGANIFPRLFVRLYEASVAQNIETIACLKEKVMKLYHTVYKISKHPSGITMGIKCTLSVMGICNDYLAPPLHNLNQAERAQVEHVLKKFTDSFNVSL
ncbi:MAG: dihydrodipicolinate synthase family protein [Chlorobi bacterium]|nr:dihydrodipicolinate synthase family protein [Chlorobiota bacterium]